MIGCCAKYDGAEDKIYRILGRKTALFTKNISFF